MGDYIIPIQIIASVLALSASYGCVMTLLNRVLHKHLLRYEAILALIAGALALSFLFVGIDVTGSLLDVSTFGTLLVAFISTLVLLVTVRFKLRDESSPAGHPRTPLVFATIAFSGFLVHLLLELASFAWF